MHRSYFFYSFDSASAQLFEFFDFWSCLWFCSFYFVGQKHLLLGEKTSSFPHIVLTKEKDLRNPKNQEINPQPKKPWMLVKGGLGVHEYYPV